MFEWYFSLKATLLPIITEVVFYAMCWLAFFGGSFLRQSVCKHD